MGLMGALESRGAPQSPTSSLDVQVLCPAWGVGLRAAALASPGILLAGPAFLSPTTHTDLDTIDSHGAPGSLPH